MSVKLNVEAFISESLKLRNDMDIACDEFVKNKPDTTEHASASKKMTDINQLHYTRRKALVSINEDEYTDIIHDFILCQEYNNQELPQGYIITVIDSYYSCIYGCYITIIYIVNNNNNTSGCLNVHTCNYEPIGNIYRN